MMDKLTFEKLEHRMAAAMRELRGEPEPVPEVPDYAQCWASGGEAKYGPHGGEMRLSEWAAGEYMHFCDNHDPDEPSSKA